MGKEERRARPLRATREASRLGVERLCLAQLLRPLPGGAEARGRSDRFLFLLFFFFFFFKSSPRPRSASPKRKARHEKHTKGGDIIWHHLDTSSSSHPRPGPSQLLLSLRSRVPSSRCGDGTWGLPVPVSWRWMLDTGRLSLWMSVGLWLGVQAWDTHGWKGGPVS